MFRLLDIVQHGLVIIGIDNLSTYSHHIVYTIIIYSRYDYISLIIKDIVKDCFFIAISSGLVAQTGFIKDKYTA